VGAGPPAAPLTLVSGMANGGMKPPWLSAHATGGVREEEQPFYPE